MNMEKQSALRLKATGALRELLNDLDIAYDDEGDVLHVIANYPAATLAGIRAVAGMDVVEEK